MVLTSPWTAVFSGLSVRNSGRFGPGSVQFISPMWPLGLDLEVLDDRPPPPGREKSATGCRQVLSDEEYLTLLSDDE
jgi:hypothetical protein